AAAVVIPLLGITALGYCVLQSGGGSPVRVPPAAAKRAHPQGDFWVGNVRRPADLNPFTTADSVVQRMILRYTHDALLDFDPQDGHLRPALARLVGQAPDGLEYELALRPNVVFTDGSPVTLDDVRFTLDAARSEGLKRGSLLDALDPVACLDEQPNGHLLIRLREPYFAGVTEIATGWRAVSKAWFPRAIPKRARRPGGAAPAPGRRR